MSKYYENSLIWEQSLSLGQSNLTKAVLDSWPDGIKKFLDVGCGDGKITSIIKGITKSEAYGIDLSETALEKCEFDTKLASATNLPFENNALSLVLCTDVIEHLNPDEECKAINELFRVANDFVFLAVPYKEILTESLAECSSCATHFHINWHKRSYDIESLSTRLPKDWNLERIVLTGESWSERSVEEILFERRINNSFAYWDCAVCPCCGEAAELKHSEVSQDALAEQFLSRSVSDSILSPRTHTEILYIFKYSDSEKCLKSLEYTPLEHLESVKPRSIECNLKNYQERTYLVNFPIYGVFFDSKDEYFYQVPFLEKSEVVTIEFLSEVHEVKFECNGGIAPLKLYADTGMQRQYVVEQDMFSRYGVLIKSKSKLKISVDDECKQAKVFYLSPSDYEYTRVEEKVFLHTIEPTLLYPKNSYLTDAVKEKDLLATIKVGFNATIQQTFEQLRVLDVFKIECTRLKEDISHLESQLLEKTNISERLSANINEMELDAENFRANLISCEKTIIQLDQIINDNNFRIDNLVEENAKAQIEHLKLLEASEACKQKLESRENSLNKLSISNQNLNAEIKSYLNTINSMNTSFNEQLAEKEKLLESTRVSIQNVEAERNSLVRQLMSNEAASEDLRVELQNAKSQCMEWKNSYNELREYFNSELISREQELERSRINNQNLAADIKFLQNAVNERELALESLRVKIQNLEAENKSLIEVEQLSEENKQDMGRGNCG